jgi:4-coumarate--CoA ligase
VCFSAGVRADRVAQVVVLHSFNCVEYPVVFLALNRLGAITSPSSPLFNAGELADHIKLGQVCLQVVL